MDNYDKYYKCIVRSVDHIFKNFFNDNSIEEVFDDQSSRNDPNVAVEINGTIKGEIIINIPTDTLNMLIKKLIPDIGSNPRAMKKHHEDVAGELANMITGTFVNQLQFINHKVKVSPPEFNDDPISMKALYDNINVSFCSSYGGFDVDLYYKEAE